MNHNNFIDQVKEIKELVNPTKEDIREVIGMLKREIMQLEVKQHLDNNLYRWQELTKKRTSTK